MKRFICALAMVCSSAFAQPASLNATVALVIDADTNDVLFHKNDTDVRPIASITKLMTAYVTVEANLPLDEQLTITQDDVNATKLRGGPTGTSLPVGTKLMRGELLQLALMNSQNRAAAALGRTYPGGITVFVEKMNETAQALGMKDTHYVDPTGLFNANQSTANDLAILVKAASQHEIIGELSTSTKFQLGPKRTFGSTNKLVHGKWGVVLQKTGFIKDAGHCLVMMTSLAARKVIIVLLNTTSNQLRARDAISLMYWVDHDEVPTAKEMSVLDPAPVAAKRVVKRKHR